MILCHCGYGTVLKQYRGAYEAWKVLSYLEFQVCVVRGSKVLIAHVNASGLQRTPPSKAEEVCRAEVIHKAYKGHVRLARSLLYLTAPTEETYPRTKNTEDLKHTEEVYHCITMDMQHYWKPTPWPNSISGREWQECDYAQRPQVIRDLASLQP